MEDLKQIRDLVEKFCGVDISEENRRKKYFLARSIYYKIAMLKTSHSLKNIADFIGKDHATVIHANKKFDSYMNDNSDFDEIYQHLKKVKFDKQKRLKKEDNKILELQNKVWTLEQELRNKITLPKSHADLVHLLNKIPEHHVELVSEWLEPKIRMLPKTPERNGR